MSYEVCPGRILIYGKTRYPAGSLVPEVPGTDELLESGVIRVVETEEKPRPKPIVTENLTSPDAGFDPADPSSVTKVSLRHLSDCLATVSDVDILKAMHEADSRKGGKDRIEERIGELAT